MPHIGLCACCGEVALVRLRVSDSRAGVAVYTACIDALPCLWRMGEYFTVWRRLTANRVISVL